MQKDAFISADGVYRYWLSRVWNDRLAKVTIIGLNPSTADASIDDPTIRRCINFVKSWGYGGFYMVNLFDMRSTDPKALIRTKGRMSYHNDGVINRCVAASDLVVFAWGAFADLKGRDMNMRVKFPNAYCLGRCKNGQPKHPLYLRKSAQLVPFIEMV